MSTQTHIDKNELYYEIVVSQGLGRLTNRAKKLIVLLAQKAIRRMSYYNPDDRADCLQTGLMIMFSNWQNFNRERFSDAFSYFTEIFKRAIAQGFNEIHRKRGEDKNNRVRMVSINSSNQGQGMFNL